MYASILTTALITYALSEALSGTSAVHPFDFGDMHDHADGAADVATDAADAAAGADYIDYEDIDIASEMADTEGLSVYSILRRIKIPGVVVGSAIDGTLNALMTLRIGYVTRTYLQQGPRAMKGVQNKRKVKLQAMKEAVVAVPSIVVSGSDIVGKKASRLILNVLKTHSQASVNNQSLNPNTHHLSPNTHHLTPKTYEHSNPLQRTERIRSRPLQPKPRHELR